MKKKSFASLFLAVLLLLLCCAPAFAQEAGDEDGEEPTPTPLPTATPLPTPRPKVSEGFYCEDLPEPQSKSILLYSLDTDCVLYALNPDERLPMASTTKIMTFIVASEQLGDLAKTTVTTPASVLSELEGTNSSVMGLLEGEQLTALELLNAMLICSANDAALSLAKYIDGLAIPAESAEDDENGDGLLSCVELMNKKARELGCTNTHFVNPHGLHDAAHYSSARDMCRITEYAMTMPHFQEIVGTVDYTLRTTNACAETRVFHTTNQLLDEESPVFWIYATGVKTGSLDEAGYCFVGSGSYEGSNVICACLGAPMYDEDGETIYDRGDMRDARALMRWSFLTFEDHVLVANGDLMSEVDLKYVWNKDRLQVEAQGNLTVSLPAEYDEDSLERRFDLPDFVEAPVEKGTRLGSVSYYYDGALLATLPLVAAESAERSEVIQTVEKGKEVLTAPWFLIVAGSIAALTAVYFAVAVALNRRRRRERARRVRRYRNLD